MARAIPLQCYAYGYRAACYFLAQIFTPLQVNNDRGTTIWDMDALGLLINYNLVKQKTWTSPSIPTYHLYQNTPTPNESALRNAYMASVCVCRMIILNHNYTYAAHSPI